jgi:hypothetical protein
MKEMRYYFINEISMIRGYGGLGVRGMCKNRAHEVQPYRKYIRER